MCSSKPAHRSMIILRSSCSKMRISDFVIGSNTLYQQQIDLFINHTTPFPHNCRGKFVRVWKPCCNKALSGHHKAPMHPRWFLLVKRQGKFIHVFITRNLISLWQETFPLPRMDEALQASHSYNRFFLF